jgi:hypothetical protein
MSENAEYRRRVPGRLLRAVASALFDSRTAERFLFPAIADLQHEGACTAGESAFRRLIVRLPHYMAFWRAFAACLAVKGAARSSAVRPLLLSMATVAVTTGLMLYGPASRDLSAVGPVCLLLLIPQALAVALPCSVLIFGFLGSRKPSHPSRPVLAYSLVICVATFTTLVWAVPACNQAYRVRAYQAALARGERRDIPRLVEVPKGSAEMTIAELRQRIADIPDDSASRVRFAYYLHQKFTIPLAAVAFGLITIALSRRRGFPGDRPAWRAFGLSAIALFTYYVLLFQGRSLALSLVLPVWLGAWGPPALFGAVALAIGAVRIRAETLAGSPPKQS